MAPRHATLCMLVSFALLPAPVAGAAALQQPGTIELTLTAAPARVQLLPGIESDAYAYNGTVPGPHGGQRSSTRVLGESVYAGDDRRVSTGRVPDRARASAARSSLP